MTTVEFDTTASSEDDTRVEHAELQHLIEHAAHFLPAQGPITVFVHHNTLHAFEHLDFDQGVQAGGRLFGCHAYLPEQRYRAELECGRFRVADIEAVLLEDLRDDADILVANFGTRYALRLAMLQFPLQSGSPAELRWLVAETDALRKFREEVPKSVRWQMIAKTRKWLERNLAATGDECVASPLLDELAEQFDLSAASEWDARTTEIFVLNFLWRVCCNGLQQSSDDSGDASQTRYNRRHRDLLVRATGEDPDLLVHDVLISFCSAFLDQGFADWELLDRDNGLYAAFLGLYGKSFSAPTRWYRKLRHEVRRLGDHKVTALDSIEESLALLGVKDHERSDFITQTLLALRGWAGMVWQMETNAEWAPRPAPSGSLVEFLAVRLILDRIAIGEKAHDALGFSAPLDQLRDSIAERTHQQHKPDSKDDCLVQRAFNVFQLAQVRGWNPEDLLHLSRVQWETLVREIESFSSLERRRIYHRAFERKYRNDTLDATITHSERLRKVVDDTLPVRPTFQIACCIDDREESFRRHLEETHPTCETFGIAGFFGVAMYYRGTEDAHSTPLCPVNIKPDHFIVEQPVYSAQELERRRAETRRRIGHATHQAHLGTRKFLGGMLVGLFGSLAAFPLVARILFPRTTAQIRRLFGSIVHTPNTELRLERTQTEPGSGNGHIGYSVEEMAKIVEGGLRAMGLAKSELISRLVIICGHGSSSLNNPHEAAYNCGACGGGRGGPNARAFSQMANDPRVRKILEQRDLRIPEDTFFVGGYHNTCDDSMTWYDLDRVPILHRDEFESAKSSIDEARKRSSHERCRRFESADLTLGFDDALRHVEGRSEDLSQTRPEAGHATNALCFVGRRAWSRGLYLDRRAFLTSYDPAQDDDRSSILEGMLRAVIPVCAGINLEYYFSYVDPIGYGCGTKLPHNITSLLGVMDGAASDLRPGLPWQMVEIHEPVRLLFLIETTREAMQRIIDDNPAIASLVGGGWVQLAVFDAATSYVHRYVRGEFVLYAPEERRIPIVNSSLEWYGGNREHLSPASILTPPSTASAIGEGPQS